MSKAGGDREDDELRAWRMKANKDIGYSGWTVNDRLEEFEKKDL